jgi:DNA polymerase-1
MATLRPRPGAMTAMTAMTKSKIATWRDLPFEQIWAIDFEYYPGAGLANGAREGDPVTPLCLVAREMRSGREVRLWQNELDRFPPYRLDAGAVIISYMLSAEFGCHLALGWGQPARALDPYVEFRHLMNDGSVRAEDRPLGFFALDGALRHFREDAIDTAHKKDMQCRIIQGPPFSAQERDDILTYCSEDVDALARLIAHVVPTIDSLPHAVNRANYMWAVEGRNGEGCQLMYRRLNELS